MRKNEGRCIVVGYEDDYFGAWFPVGCVVVYDPLQNCWVHNERGYTSGAGGLIVENLPKTDAEKATLMMLYPQLEGKI